MFNARVLFSELFFPFVSNNIALLLSWYRMFFSTSYPCASRNSLVQSIITDTWSTPNSSDLVLFFVFSYILRKWSLPLHEVSRTHSRFWIYLRTREQGHQRARANCMHNWVWVDFVDLDKYLVDTVMQRRYSDVDNEAERNRVAMQGKVDFFELYEELEWIEGSRYTVVKEFLVWVFT